MAITETGELLWSDLPLIWAYAAMPLLRRSISFSFTSMLIWKTGRCYTWRHVCKYGANCWTVFSSRPSSSSTLLCSVTASQATEDGIFWRRVGGLKLVSLTQKLLCGPEPSAEINIAHLTDGAQPVTFPLNRDRPLLKRSALRFSKHWDGAPSSPMGSPDQFLQLTLKVALNYIFFPFQLFFFIFPHQLHFSSADCFCCRGGINLLEYIFMWSVFTACGWCWCSVRTEDGTTDDDDDEGETNASSASTNS